MEGKIIAFSHIPKNAGSLITYLLRIYFGTQHCRAFSKHEVYNFSDFKNDQLIYPGLKAISGHQLRPYVDFGEYEANMLWSILLRDPYERFPSQYKWWCKRNKSKISFEEWCSSKGAKFSDFQCRWVSGDPDYVAALNVVSSKKIVVGFQDDITGFLRRVTSLIGVREFPWNVSMVVNKASQTNSSSYSRELIEKYNAHDIQLYQYLRKQHEPQSLVGNDEDWTRDLNLTDKTRYYLNLLKHGAYKLYKKARPVDRL